MGTTLPQCTLKSVYILGVCVLVAAFLGNDFNIKGELVMESGVQLPGEAPDFFLAEIALAAGASGLVGMGFGAPILTPRGYLRQSACEAKDVLETGRKWVGSRIRRAVAGFWLLLLRPSVACESLQICVPRPVRGLEQEAYLDVWCWHQRLREC